MPVYTSGSSVVDFQGQQHCRFFCAQTFEATTLVASINTAMGKLVGIRRIDAQSKLTSQTHRRGVFDMVLELVEKIRDYRLLAANMFGQGFFGLAPFLFQQSFENLPVLLGHTTPS